jgi:RimJ/RimL family protein N-acetyltransferase
MRFFHKIVGERLYLSPFDRDDPEIIAKWAEWMNDRTVADTFDGYHTLVSFADAKKTLESLIDYRFAMVLLDSDVLIGHISLHNIDHFNRNAFIGIFIGNAENRSKGYGTEAVRVVLNFGFKALNLNNIMLSVHADNHAAIACYTKVGFREAGRRREWVFKDGNYIDKIYMDILAREFTT